MITTTEQAIIDQAVAILARELRAPGAVMSQPAAAKQYLTLQLATLEHEVFAVLLLDTRHRVIACEHLFRGTIDNASVHPREVVKTALRHNAAALIAAHNHPSGHAEPSEADLLLTNTLKAALALVDVRLLDHIVIGGLSAVSLAERGEL